MYSTQPHTAQQFKLNGERVTRSYFAQVVTEIKKKGKKRVKNTVATEFSLTYFGMDKENMLKYRLQVENRFLLNERGNIIKKPKKAERIALMVAKINDLLEFRLNKGLQLIEVTNVEEIRDKWIAVKTELLAEFPDLQEMAVDFDWQLQDENIQQVFLNDNFFSFLFSNLFYQEFEEGSPNKRNKIVSNGIGSIDVPIIEERTLVPTKSFFKDIKVRLIGDFDIAHEKFPKAKLNVFLGDLAEKKGDKRALDFGYQGMYWLKPELGLVVKGELEYDFNIEGLYQKKTKMTFNMEEYGR